MRQNLIARANFLQATFGPGIINGESIALTCPQCSKGRKDKKKLIVKLEDGMHHCWVCGLKGKTLKYTIKKYAPKKYEEYESIFQVFEAKEKKEKEVEEIPKLEIPKGFILLGQNLKSRDPDVRATIEYAYSRGITKRDLWFYKFGTCKSGSFRRRLILPSFNSMGELNYYTGRSIDDNSHRKYLNAKAKKKDLILNQINIDWSKELTVVEGPLDLVKCNYNATSILGSFLDKNYFLFQEIVANLTPVLLALDPDAKIKQQKICKDLYSYGIKVRVLDYGSHEDVGDMTKEEFLTLKNSAKSWNPRDILKYRINSIRSGSLV